MIYNWQKPDWPNFTFDPSGIEDDLLLFVEKTAHLKGVLEGLPTALREEAVVDLMTAEAMKTSEIEGEYISRKDVKSSIRNNLGLNEKPENVHDLRAIGLGEMMAAVRKATLEELTEKQLFHWHKLLLGYRKDLTNIGKWRTHSEPMQIISGAMGREKVHFEAPPSEAVPKMMTDFFSWFNFTEGKIKDAPVKAAVAHLYFESIHPFEDGNGRIGRAIAEKALAEGLGAPVPFSLSRTIEAGKKEYYAALEKAQHSNEITEWVEYFIPIILQSVEKAQKEIAFILKKSRFLDRCKNELNERQLKVIRRMFEAGHEGFEGGMNARKYGSLTGVSKATATRDLQTLHQIGALTQIGGGRSIRYELNLEHH